MKTVVVLMVMVLVCASCGNDPPAPADHCDDVSTANCPAGQTHVGPDGTAYPAASCSRVVDAAAAPVSGCVAHPVVDVPAVFCVASCN